MSNTLRSMALEANLGKAAVNDDAEEALKSLLQVANGADTGVMSVLRIFSVAFGVQQTGNNPIPDGEIDPSTLALPTEWVIPSLVASIFAGMGYWLLQYFQKRDAAKRQSAEYLIEKLVFLFGYTAGLKQRN